MKLFLFNVLDGDNVINKSLGEPLEIDIRLDINVDVSNPEIRLRNIVNVDYDNYNYAYIDVLERYYFIDKLGRVSANDNILYLSCDVLETYKDDILNSNARFKRNIKTGDYVDVDIDKSVVKSLMVYSSDKTLVDGDATIILTVIGDWYG